MPRLPYLPALDGLRALAIIAVLLYHAEPARLPGGFLGVDVFFVISAYLITALLSGEYQAAALLSSNEAHADGRIDLCAFWARRARRLLPAAFLLIALTLAAAVLWLPAEVAALRGDALSAGAYVSNWYLIASRQSYFESAGRPSLLRHLWSLAVEEQFYLLWPLLLLPLLRLRSHRLRAGIVAGAAIVSALWMAYLYDPAQDPSRVYYGTDTRAAALLAGAALALVWTPWRGARPLGRARAGMLSGAGLLALCALAAVCLRVNESDARLFRGGLLGVAVLSAVAIAAAAQAQGMFARLLARDPLRWIGVRSYSLYLWHWPVFMLTRPQLDVPLDGPPLLLLRLSLTLALAELSYRLVEMPVRDGVLGAAWHRLLEPHRRIARAVFGGASAAALAGLVLLGSAVALAQPPGPPEWLLAAQREAASESVVPLKPHTALTSPVSYMHAAGTSESTTAANPADAHQGPAVPAHDATVPQPGESGPSGSLSGILPDVIPADENLGTASRVGGDGPSGLTTFAIDDGLPGLVSLTPGSLPASLAPGLPGDGPSSPVSERLDGGSAVEVSLPARAPADDVLDVAKLPAASAPEPGSDRTQAAAVESAPPVRAQGSAPPAVLPPVAPLLSPERAAEVTAIGDSVMLSAAAEMRRVLGPIEIDAQLGRHSSTTVALLRARRDAGLLGSVVIIQTGNNGYLSVQEMRAMLKLLEAVPRVVFVSLHVPRAWEQNNNDILRGEIEGLPNVTLVDWSAESAGHREYFWDDGMHLRPYGARAYSTLIAAALASP